MDLKTEFHRLQNLRSGIGIFAHDMSEKTSKIYKIHKFPLDILIVFVYNRYIRYRTSITKGNIQQSKCKGACYY